MSALQRFHQAANDALVKLSEHCLPGAKIALVIYTPGEPERDIILKDQGLDDNEVVSALRRRGMSIDGDNSYKRDLLDVIDGALVLGYQGRNKPPAGHWANRFWDIGSSSRQPDQPAPVAVVIPFAEKVISKLRRFDECTSDGQDVDISREWFDTLTHLGLLVRVQRSPAYWEMTQQGEDALAVTRLNTPQ